MTSLSDFAVTDRQRQIADLSQQMSLRQVATSLGLCVSTVRGHYHAVRRKAEKQGYSPEHGQTHPCPDSQYVKGVSTLYDKRTGEEVLQWVKTSADQDRLAEFAKELAASIVQTVPRAGKVAAPKKCDKERLAVYPIGDAHIGLYCWKEDSGGDYDLKIAKQIMTAGFSQILAATPDTEQAVIINLGDWFHTDTEENVTRRAGNHLDVDTRWALVVRTGVAIMKFMAEAALRKHKRVHIINEIGNHDNQSSVMLSLVMGAYYEQNPRLTVDTSPDSYHWYEWHNNLIGVHHGHRCKPQDLYRVMAERQREACGRCQHRYWYTGHVHHSQKQDIGGQTIESFRSVIPEDAWAHGQGYTSQKDLCSITLHRKFGECSRATTNVNAFSAQTT